MPTRAGRFKLTVKRVGDVQKALRKFAKRYPDAMAKAMFEEGMSIERNAVQLAPYKVGNLRRSSATVLTRSNKRIQVEIGFGIRYPVTYANFQHWNHRTRSLFLTQPFEDAQQGMPKRIAARTEMIVETGETTRVPEKSPTTAGG
jgi:hypothetical protein